MRYDKNMNANFQAVTGPGPIEVFMMIVFLATQTVLTFKKLPKIFGRKKHNG